MAPAEQARSSRVACFTSMTMQAERSTFTGPYRAGSSSELPGGPGQWNSPIVTDGRIVLPEGDANDHRTSGILNIYR
jgi:hypothetical protein